MDQKTLKQLNTLFGRELGRNKHGDPNYKWQWSETFLHNMVLEGKRDWKQVPGSTIYAPQPVTQIRKMCPWLNQQWLISKWYWEPEDAWRKQFGSTLEWPHRGFYLFVDNTDLPHGVEPTLHITQSFIEGMKTQLEKTFADFIAESETGLALEQKHIGDRIMDVLDDATPAFANVEPGTRSGGVSIPTPEFSKNYERSI